MFIARSICKGKVRVYSRASVITKAYLMKDVEVHIGNKFVELNINKKMIGKRFGDFALTRRLGGYIHKKKKKKGKMRGKRGKGK